MAMMHYTKSTLGIIDNVIFDNIKSEKTGRKKITLDNKRIVRDDEASKENHARVKNYSLTLTKERET